VLAGLGGNDTYGIGLGDTVVEEEGGGIDTVSSSTVNIALLAFAHVENATLTGAAPLTASGNAQDNILNGAANTAANVLTGFGGDDTYIVGVGDTVVEATGSGTDTVQSATRSLNLAGFLHVENIVLTGTLALSATGNAGDNRIDGAQISGPNVLNGGAGNDTYIVGAGDTVLEAAGGGTDTVLARANFTLGIGASVEAIKVDFGTAGLTLTGNALPQTITGGAGNDVLTGGSGGDALIGGAGTDVLKGTTGSADRFAFLLPSDSGLGAVRDLIQGFDGASGDRIDLSEIDANLALFGDQAFTFLGAAGAFSAGGQLRFVTSGGDSFLLGSISGPTAAFEIRIQGVTSLAAGDFIL
jgi:Ca2+-binding RTX toxin-like protein